PGKALQPVQQQDREKLRFCMRPDDIGVPDALKIAPGVDQVKAEHDAQREADDLSRRGFVVILGMRDRASHHLRAIIAVRLGLVDAEDLAVFPAALPGLRSVAIGEMNKDLNRARRQFTHSYLLFEPDASGNN